MTFYRSDFTIVLRDFFSVMKFIGLLFFVPAIVSAFSMEFPILPGFLVVGLGVFVICRYAAGLFDEERETEFRHAMVTVVMVWLMVSLHEMAGITLLRPPP